MKLYRVFIIDLGILPSDYLNCQALVTLGIGNIDGFYKNCIIRHPLAAVWRIRQPFNFEKAVSKNKLEKLILSKQVGLFYGKIRNTINNYQSFFDFARDNAADDDLFFCICRKKDQTDSAVIIFGHDVIPVNLATAETSDPFYKTLDILLQRENTNNIYDVANHIIYSNEYLKNI